ncbi:unnamed protein product [Pleuronectes platessa]|uniref:Uncharacterized protein n=1 Tax=Pleuronectes platessa TaxID=8262 RepID=A0A9N7YU26_PLEPL|nr:unnamed protein product [Pleuronectes platessa]
MTEAGISTMRAPPQPVLTVEEVRHKHRLQEIICVPQWAPKNVLTNHTDVLSLLNMETQGAPLSRSFTVNHVVTAPVAAARLSAQTLRGTDGDRGSEGAPPRGCTDPNDGEDGEVIRSSGAGSLKVIPTAVDIKPLPNAPISLEMVP